MKKVLMILSHDPKGDIRVEKEVRALQKEGCFVEVLYSKDKRFPKPVWFILWQLKVGMFSAKLYTPTIVHCHDLDTVLLGLILKKRRGAKLVFDSHEYYLWTMKGIEKMLYPYFWVLQKVAQRSVNVLIVISATMREYFEKRYRFKKIVIVRNTQ